jgi:hypothetical protein
LLGSTFRCQGQQPISVELRKKDYRTSYVLWVNGVRIPQRNAYRALSELHDEKVSTPVIVLMSPQCSFDDWDDIRALLYSKIGFRDVRYFIVSEETKYMSEVKMHPAMPISSNPPESESR